MKIHQRVFALIGHHSESGSLTPGAERALLKTVKENKRTFVKEAVSELCRGACADYGVLLVLIEYTIEPSECVETKSGFWRELCELVDDMHDELKRIRSGAQALAGSC